MTPEEPRIRVLLADDSRPMRSLIRSVFPPGPGCPDFHEVANGEEAVAAYRQRRHDIVILDIRMPVLDGLEALADIRAYDEDAFVVMISGELTPADDYLLKTVDLAQLKKVWTRFLAAAKEEFLTDA